MTPSVLTSPSSRKRRSFLAVLTIDKTSGVECVQMIAPLFAAAVLAASFVSPIKQFRLLEKSHLPGRFLQNLCDRTEEKSVNKDCPEDFNKDGAVWAGDVNDDGVDEFIIGPRRDAGNPRTGSFSCAAEGGRMGRARVFG